MDTSTGLIAVVPDRVPGYSTKDLRLPYFGHPLVSQSVLFARACREVQRVLVAQSDPGTATQLGLSSAQVFEAPVGAAFPDFDLLKRAAAASEAIDGERVKLVLLLNPLMPHRDPLMLMECFQRLVINGWATGIVGMHRAVPGEQPLFTEVDGFIHASQSGEFALNQSFFLWRRDVVEEAPALWYADGRHLGYDMDEAGSRTVDPRGDLKAQEEWAKHRHWAPSWGGSSYI